MSDGQAFTTGAYIVCSILFILSLGGLSSPETSKRGNWFGIMAMTLSIVAAIFDESFEENWLFLFPSIAIGGVIGTIMAVKVEMISMPQMVAALHSFVGLAATIVAFANFFHVYDINSTSSHSEIPSDSNQQASDPVSSNETSTYVATSINLSSGEEFGVIETVETVVGIFIGAITFTGSIVACGKLMEWIRSDPLILGGSFRHVLNALMIIASCALGVLFYLEGNTMSKFYYLLGIAVIAGILGWHLVMAIGGADMPVVVSMLNSYSGWATAASGFLLINWLLIVTGALVGSSGAILSYIMCKAMNRSFFSVISGGFGVSYEQDESKKSDREPEKIDLDHMVDWLKKAKSVIIVPGYGMAVARCQHLVAELTNLLTKAGKKVRFCIHPVAGRLPGHMNVLLAEAEVDYKFVKEMDEINEEFKATDLVFVVGANDTVNPDAIDNPKCSIAGMPVCRVWEAKNVIVFKRSAGGQGYSKADNPLFTKINTRMYYGNAFKSLEDINQKIKSSHHDFTSSVVVHEEEHHHEETAADLLKDLPEWKMTIGVPKEREHLEKRVAMTPTMVPKFRRLGFRVLIEKHAGKDANFSDEVYEHYGAEIVERKAVWKADIILKVRKVNHDEEKRLKHTKVVISYVSPSMHVEWLEKVAEDHPHLTYLAMDQVPRISRAQKLDSLSSMANIGGYRAVMEAFAVFQKCPKPMITAAGKLPQANVLIMGAGVAGLAAIGCCKNLGCMVKAMDTRSAAKEDAESMGAKFLEVSVKEEGATAGGYSKVMSEEYIRAQYELTRNTARTSDIIITTALIPGRKAPILIDDNILAGMRAGSVIVDMAAEMGGNCSQTKPDEIVETENGVKIIGFTDLTSRMAPQSSELYANNLFNLLTDMGGASHFKVNIEDEIIGAMAVIHEGKKIWYSRAPAPAPAASTPASKPLASSVPVPSNSGPSCYSQIDFLVITLVLIGVFVGISYALKDEEEKGGKSFMDLMMIFVMAIFIGYMVIWNVTPALHTPLMSVTNAISGIIVIGAMLLLGPYHSDFDYQTDAILAVLSVFFASINIFGGFIVTYRMLLMFKTGMPASSGHHH
jgi:NAD(P) transhydrogenase